MARIPILNVITRLEQGGAPLALIETVRRMDGGQFEISVACGYSEDPNLELCGTSAVANLQILSVPTMRRSVSLLGDLTALVQLIGIIRRGRYQIVHTHTSKAGVIGRIAAAFCHVPAIVHSPHGTILEGYFGPGLTRFYVFVERLVSRVSHRIICLTRQEIRQYMKAGIGSRRQFTFVYNGIDIARYSDRANSRAPVRRDLGIPDEATVCISVGRLVPVKGHADLIRGFARALSEHDDLVLLLAGDGELRDELTALVAELGLGDRVRFLGWRDDTADLLAGSDIFVLPSLNEGLGLVLIEAMAANLPVVATRVGGVPEVVEGGQTGLLVEARDPDQISSAILRLARDRALRERMGRAGRERADAHFSIQATVRRTEQIYNDLVEEAG
jgi:glycosyltransferase involved in cell wall biosynthesis